MKIVRENIEFKRGLEPKDSLGLGLKFHLIKIFKKIISRHVGSEGSFNIYWETENASGTFVIPLDTYPTQWNSYFPSTAYGKEVNFEIQKNDLYNFKVSEIKGLFSPHRTII